MYTKVSQLFTGSVDNEKNLYAKYAIQENGWEQERNGVRELEDW